jgi:hypothetical protein
LPATSPAWMVLGGLIACGSEDVFTLAECAPPNLYHRTRPAPSPAQANVSTTRRQKSRLQWWALLPAAARSGEDAAGGSLPPNGVSCGPGASGPSFFLRVEPATFHPSTLRELPRSARSHHDLHGSIIAKPHIPPRCDPPIWC